MISPVILVNYRQVYMHNTNELCLSHRATNAMSSSASHCHCPSMIMAESLHCRAYSHIKGNEESMKNSLIASCGNQTSSHGEAKPLHCWLSWPKQYMFLKMLSLNDEIYKGLSKGKEFRTCLQCRTLAEAGGGKVVGLMSVIHLELVLTVLGLMVTSLYLKL